MTRFAFLNMTTFPIQWVGLSIRKVLCREREATLPIKWQSGFLVWGVTQMVSNANNPLFAARRL